MQIGNDFLVFKCVNHTNIILINVPYRHDVRDYSHVNNTIKSFNSKLPKLAKIVSHVSIMEIVNNRLIYQAWAASK